MAARFFLRSELCKAQGPFIGPRGGKWADAEHKIPWKEETPGTAHGGYHAHQWSALGEHFQKVGEAAENPYMKARSHARAEMAHYYAGGGKDPAEAEKLYHYRMAKQGQPKDETDTEALSYHLKWKMEKLHAQSQGAEAPKPAAVPEKKPLADISPGQIPKGTAASEEQQEMSDPKLGAAFKVGGTIKLGNQAFVVLGIHKFIYKNSTRYEVYLKKPKGTKGYHGVLYENGVWSSVAGLGGNIAVPAGYKHKVAQPEGTAEGESPAASVPEKAPAPGPSAVSDAESAHAQAKQIFSELDPEEQAKVAKILNETAKPGDEKFIPAAPKSGAPQFPGESLAAGDHIIVGKHKFQVVEAPVHDPAKSKVVGNDYFKLKVKKPGGSKIFDAQVHDAGGKPFWNVTDKGKQVVGMYSGGNEGHQKVSAETKAPKHEAVKQEAIGKANKHDIDAVPTGLASAWHKRWSYGTQPEPVSGSLNKMVASYLLRHHEKGMSAEDHMAAAKFHQQYGADVMSGKKLPSLPHKTARSHRQQLHENLADFHEKMATNPDFVDKVYAIAGKKPKVKKSFSGIDGIGEYLKNSRFEEIDMAQDSLEKGFPPPAAPAPVAGNGAAPGGAYTRRWKGPAGKWLYEYEDPTHKTAIDASNAAETHPGTAGDLIGAHQQAAQAHLKAAQSMGHDPQASAEHAQVAADHAKAAAVVHSNYFLEKDKAAAGAPEQPTPPPAAPAGQAPGQPAAAGPQPPAKPPVPPPAAGQPGQVPGKPPVAPAAPAAAPAQPQPPPDMKTTPSAPGGGQTPAGPPQSGGKPVVAIGSKGGKVSKFKKSIEGIEALNEYLAKADGMPEGNPKEQLGTGEEQGGKLAGVGKQSGDNDSTSKEAGAPSVQKDKLSEDDREDEDQMKSHKKPIETAAKSMSVPGHQRELVAHEHAVKVTQLQKSDDVTHGIGVATPAGAAPEPVRSLRWQQGRDGMVTYSNQSDLEVERLCKSDDFYQYGDPQVTRASLFINQQVRCHACQNLMAKSLAVCPSCGEGAQRAIPRVISDGESAPKPEYNRPGLLRPARHRGDVYFPGK